jgi:hypothetical protein
MKSPRSLITACFLFFLFAFNTAAQTNKITAAEAKDHVCETRTVCAKNSQNTLRLEEQGRANIPEPRRAIPEGSFHDLNLGQRSRQIRNARNEI